MYKEFLADKDAWDMYITGPAGTGKTTSLAEIVEYMEGLKLNYAVCAFTHKACSILATSLPNYTPIGTLHSVLRKRPTVNSNALLAKHVENSAQIAIPDELDVLIIDEFSIVGEQDYLSIVDMQDPNSEGELAMKVIYIGDLNQLPPVKDIQTIVPGGKYHKQLTKIYRQAGDNELLTTLTMLNKYISTDARVGELKPNKNFIRGVDLVLTYNSCSTNKVLLAYTNHRVQDLNALVEGRHKPIADSDLFCPSNRNHYTFDKLIARNNIEAIELPYSGQLLYIDSKYKTLENLLTMDDSIEFGLVDSIEGSTVLAYVFGHKSYKDLYYSLMENAANANKTIEDNFKLPAAKWAAANNKHPLARKRGKAWRDFLTFKECVCCLDFSHAMTVHKSQGSTYDNVFLDIQDLGLCSTKNYILYLKLAYVAISRASKMVYTN